MELFSIIFLIIYNYTVNDIKLFNNDSHFHFLVDNIAHNNDLGGTKYITKE